MSKIKSSKVVVQCLPHMYLDHTNVYVAVTLEMHSVTLLEAFSVCQRVAGTMKTIEQLWEISACFGGDLFTQEVETMIGKETVGEGGFAYLLNQFQQTLPKDTFWEFVRGQKPHLSLLCLSHAELAFHWNLEKVAWIGRMGLWCRDLGTHEGWHSYACHQVQVSGYCNPWPTSLTPYCWAVGV